MNLNKITYLVSLFFKIIGSRSNSFFSVPEGKGALKSPRLYLKKFKLEKNPFNMCESFLSIEAEFVMIYYDISFYQPM